MKEMNIHSETINYIHTEFDTIYSTKKCVIYGKNNNRKPPNAFIKTFFVDIFLIHCLLTPVYSLIY